MADFSIDFWMAMPCLAPGWLFSNLLIEFCTAAYEKDTVLQIVLGEPSFK